VKHESLEMDITGGVLPRGRCLACVLRVARRTARGIYRLDKVKGATWERKRNLPNNNWQLFGAITRRKRCKAKVPTAHIPFVSFSLFLSFVSPRFLTAELAAGASRSSFAQIIDPRYRQGP